MLPANLFSVGQESSNQMIVLFKILVLSPMAGIARAIELCVRYHPRDPFTHGGGERVVVGPAQKDLGAQPLQVLIAVFVMARSWAAQIALHEPLLNGVDSGDVVDLVSNPYDLVGKAVRIENNPSKSFANRRQGGVP